MTRAFGYIAALIVGASILPFLQASTVPSTLVVGIMLGIAVPLIDVLVANSRYLRLAYYSIRYTTQNIRISASYLFRIKIDSTYLLIRGRRWDHYQPIGGVYKTSPGAKSIMDKLGALDDDLVPIDEMSLHDLRIRIPGRKIIPFVRWFESGHSRETSPWREFYEELIGSGLLARDDFPFIFEDFIRREIRPIRFSQYAQSMELQIADIYELLPTSNQLSAIKALKDANRTDILWATETQIRHLGAIPGTKLDLQIAEPAIWTL